MFHQFLGAICANFRHFAQVCFSPLQPCSRFFSGSRSCFSLPTRFHPFRQSSDVCPFFCARSVAGRGGDVYNRGRPGSLLPVKKLTDRPQICFLLQRIPALWIKSVSIVDRFAVCSETAFLSANMGLPPHTPLGALPQTPPGTLSLDPSSLRAVLSFSLRRVFSFACAAPRTKA